MHELFGPKVKKAILVGAVALAVMGCSTTGSGSGSTSGPELNMMAACEQHLGAGGKVTPAFCNCFKENMNGQINNSSMSSSDKATARQQIEDVYNKCMASTASYTDFANANRPA